MFPGMNSRQMKQAMKKMGIAQQELPATEVIIKFEDKELVISNPNVSKVNMMGQETYQVVGEAVERTINTAPDLNDEDIKTVMEQTGASEEKVREILAENGGDLADAIMNLKTE